MTDLIQLNDVEIAAVAGGAIPQSASASANPSALTLLNFTAAATNSGAASATNGTGSGNTAAASGAESSTTGVFTQVNMVQASNSLRISH
jgi:hypothetical protein